MPRVRKNDLEPPGIQIGKAIFNQPPVHLGTAVGSRRRHCAQPDRLAPVAGAFCHLIKVRVHYRGAVRGLFLLAGFGLRVSFMLFKNCCYNVFIDTHIRTFCPFLQGFFANFSAFFPLYGQPFQRISAIFSACRQLCITCFIHLFAPLYRSTQHLYMSRHIFYTHLLRQIVIFSFFSFCMFCAWIYVTAYSII